MAAVEGARPANIVFASKMQNPQAVRLRTLQKRREEK